MATVKKSCGEEENQKKTDAPYHLYLKYKKNIIILA